MVNVLLILKNEAEALLNELKGSSELSVKTSEVPTEDEILAMDIIVTDKPMTAKKPVVLICDTESLGDAAYTASDFVCRPIRTAELIARIMRLIAPATRKSEQNVFRDGELTIDFENATVHFSGTLIHLTLFEYKLLCLLAQNHGKLVTYDQILHSLWESPIGNEMLSIRVFINAIRRKFAAAGAMEDIIKTHAGKGYSLI